VDSPAMIGSESERADVRMQHPVAPQPRRLSRDDHRTFDDTLLLLVQLSYVQCAQVGGLKVSIANVTPSAAVRLAVGLKRQRLHCDQRSDGGRGCNGSDLGSDGARHVLRAGCGRRESLEPVTLTVTVIHS